jgi:hypothetical protein
MGPTIHQSYYGTPHTHQFSDHKGNLKSLSQTNTAPLPPVFGTDTPTQMEPSFIITKRKMWVTNTAMYCP